MDHELLGFFKTLSDKYCSILMRYGEVQCNGSVLCKAGKVKEAYEIILGKFIIYYERGHFTAASDLFLAYTSTFENLGSNMILLKSLDDAGEVILAIEDVKKIGNMSAPMVYEIIVISFINVKTTANFEVDSSD
ncbi:hypothetical protein Tco_0965056 [Tanacetum coccineum]